MRILLSAAIAACLFTTPAQAEEQDLHGLMIEIGRWSVMQDQIDEHAAIPAAYEQNEADAPLHLARDLRAQVWRLNLQRAAMCEAGRFTQATCVRGFAPSWLSEDPTRRVSLHTLQQRSAAVGREISALQGEVCDEARAKVEDQQERMYVCALE